MKERIKEISKIVKGNLILLLGVGLFAHSLFNFSSGRYCDKESSLFSMDFGCTHPATFYYYDNITLTLLVVGAILITIGLLNKKKW